MESNEKSLAWIRRDIAQLRQDGYAVRQPGITRGSATLAVPVLQDSTAIATLSMTTYGRSMTRPTIERHVPILIETARAIAAALGTTATS